MNFSPIIHSLIQRQLGRAIQQLDNELKTSSYPQTKRLEQTQKIKADYQLMLDYYIKGFKDNRREEFYQNLIEQLYSVAANAELDSIIRQSPHLLQKKEKLQQFDASYEHITHVLEEFVAERALLGLDTKTIDSQGNQTVFTDHHLFLSELFDYIFLSEMWQTADYEHWKAILLSPIIDPTDSLLIVSAIFLSNTFCFDPKKTKLLIELSCHKDVDEKLRQRALVGWALTVNERANVYPQIRQSITIFCQSEQNINQLVELQKQIYFCLDTEKDTETIQKDIMPELIKHSNLNVTRFGIEEKDEDSIENILNNDDEEDGADQVERTMQKMFDMQKAGADIYFGGFSQMKRFAFFMSLANWFVPFYAQHPDIQTEINKIGKNNFTENTILDLPFCDSDKYSFLLALSSIINQLPESMREMIGGNLGFEVYNSETNINSPAYIRRMYLQDLYRFFNLYTYKQCLKNPFVKSKKSANSALFVDNTIFENTALHARLPEIGMFLLGRKNYHDVQILLNAIGADSSVLSLLLKAQCLFISKQYKDCTNILRKLLSTAPENTAALNLLAKVCVADGKTSEATQVYEKLLEHSPENLNLRIKYYLILGKTERRQEAISGLYQLYYDYPENKTVQRVLAWILLLAGKTEQAGGIYEKLLSDGGGSEDCLNAGYYYWISRNLDKAKDLFKEYVSGKEPTTAHRMLEKQFSEDLEVLVCNEITTDEIPLMIDSVCY